MAQPHPSWVVGKNDDGTTYVKHCLIGEHRNNSHTQICRTHKVPEDSILKVELHVESLTDPNNTEPVPWDIDRLPSGVRYLEDCDPVLLEACENAAHHFMTPDNVYAYICQVDYPDAAKFVAGLFTEEYYARWSRCKPETSALLAPDNVITSALGLPRAETASTTRTARVPMFTTEDIRNPAAWAKLPD